MATHRAFGCAASSPDPRRRAIAALLATAAGDRGSEYPALGLDLARLAVAAGDPKLLCVAVDAYAQGPRPFELALAGRPAAAGAREPADPAGAGRSRAGERRRAATAWPGR